ncbi:MAG: aminomethyltransferase family protein, partial [Pseudomonadota bacterium]
RALFFKPSPEFEDMPGFGFTPSHAVVAEEVRCVAERVGLMEVSGFTRYEISGAGAAEWLAGLFAGRIPQRVGKVGLGYFLTDAGNVLGEATLAKLSEDRFWWGSAAGAELHDWDWLMARKPAEVELAALTTSHSMLVVAGPNARALLSRVAPGTDWSREAFPWLSAQPVSIGGAPAMALSVSYSGELAWELHIPCDRLVAAHDALWTAGAEFGLGRFGLLAAESMRLEKGYRHWKADLITEFDPFESALDRFVRLDHDFPGQPALEEKAGTPPRRCFVTLDIACQTAPAHPGDSIYDGDRVVGTVTSAAWGHRLGRNLAMGFVTPTCAAEATALSIDLIGTRHPAKVTQPCLYDPDNLRVRG